MRPKRELLRLLAGLFLARGAAASSMQSDGPQLRDAIEDSGNYPSLEIQHPIAGAVLPLNFPPPVVTWKTNTPEAEVWATGLKVGGRAWWFEETRPMWRPSAEVWQQVKAAGPALM